jgi:hypothetical protein
MVEFLEKVGSDKIAEILAQDGDISETFILGKKRISFTDLQGKHFNF